MVAAKLPYSCRKKRKGKKRSQSSGEKEGEWRPGRLKLRKADVRDPLCLKGA